ncbi:hypothetical protein C7H19_09320 [Aphanothece hegewaldii CCALA 016]|uniref:GGDEF domain-containing protein n=1 Tax=Aphanothece hegewaldii CCALA 016 TaxID=2107694 RepID=A0A2T1LZB6_9CHRO|nr:GGDEF domain-containing protein [Aphanothece hegewaldii]PSF37737.1 hypothetical protein C7H19_09320 [Aphanothece hegewaldii CCALA 016]
MLKNHNELNIKNKVSPMIKPQKTIVNHRYLIEFLQKELQNIHQYEDSLSLLIMAIEEVQELDDNQFAKDEIIGSVTKSIIKCIRRDDCFAQLSKDEYVILLQFTNTQAAITVAQRLCRKVSGLSFIINQHLIKPTLKIGIASSQKSDLNIDEILTRAKEALLTAKNNKDNNFIVHPIDLEIWLAQSKKTKNY